MVAITDLPAELIETIHLHALNPFLPQTSSYIHSILRSPAPSYAATYLLRLYGSYGPDEILVRALRHPICGIEVVSELIRRWDRLRGYVRPLITPRDKDKAEHTERQRGEGTSGNDGSISISRARSRSRSRSRSPTPPPPPTAPGLTCSELPRRLFRTSHPAQPLPPIPTHNKINPLVKYLFENFTPSPKSHKGYPLCRAVLTSDYTLVSYLLGKGADPSIKDGLALEIAISTKDLKMVKLLVESDNDVSLRSPSKSTMTVTQLGTGTGTPPKKGKKLRMDPEYNDRMRIGTNMVELAMKKGSKDIVHYFVYEKKVMPPLQSIMKLGHSQTPSITTKEKNYKSNEKGKGKKRNRAF